jgi:ankyrin repeat protein
LYFSARAHSWLGATGSIVPLAVPVLLFFGTDLEAYVHRIKVSFERNKEGRFPEPAQRDLFKAIRASDYPAMQRILAGHTNLNVRDEAGADLLAYAVNETQILRANTPDRQAEDAESLKCVEGVRLLLAAGADPNQSTDVYGNSTFLGSASRVSRPMPQGWEADPAGAKVFRLFLDHGANPNALKEGRPLIFSVRTNPDSMQVLLDHGVDINVRDEEGNTTLLFFLWNGWWDAALFVLERGADVNTQNQSGMTPDLALAAAVQRAEITRSQLPEAYDKVKTALESRRTSKGQ